MKPLYPSPELAAQAFQRGEEKALEYFFKKLFRELCATSYKITKDYDSAKDIAQSTFIKIWQSHATLSHQKVIKSWLYTAVINASLNEKAREKKLIKQEMGDTEGYNFLEPTLRAESYSLIQAALTTLPPQALKIIKLLFFERLTTKEVANELGLSESSVKTQKARSLKLLRIKFDITEDEVRENNQKLINRIFNSDKSVSSLVNLYGMNKNSIQAIKSGRALKTIVIP